MLYLHKGYKLISFFTLFNNNNTVHLYLPLINDKLSFSVNATSAKIRMPSESAWILQESESYIIIIIIIIIINEYD